MLSKAARNFLLNIETVKSVFRIYSSSTYSERNDKAGLPILITKN
jgi:hypothetical protein